MEVIVHKAITRNAINGIRGCWMSVAAIFALAALRASATDYGWNPTIYEGYLNENWYDANQQSGTPGAGDSENISSAASTYSGVYTIKVPAAEYVDGPRLLVGDLPSGTKVTFDATGSAWVKQRGSTDPAWGNDPLFNVANSGGSIFSIYNKTGTLGFTLQNGKISADFGASGSLFKFESGTFNNAYHIDQTTESTL